MKSNSEERGAKREMKLRRRPRVQYFALCISLFALLILAGCGDDGRFANVAPRPGVRMLVIGMDGLDPKLVQKLMDEGKLPNFARLSRRGVFTRLGTAMPPQSPVAWSSFISGADPGAHQIFDFIHRRLKPSPGSTLVIEPYLSTSDIEPVTSWYNAVLPPALGIPFTNWRMPLSGSAIVSLRKGPSFWDSLVAAGIKTVIYRMPANYPPPQIKGHAPFHCLCGMGTPDINGDYGTATSFLEDMLKDEEERDGVRYVRLDVIDQRATARLRGPVSPLRAQVFKHYEGYKNPVDVTPHTFCDVTISRDPADATATIRTSGRTLLLKQGEWSDWTPIELQADLDHEAALAAIGVPTRVPGMVRFFLRAVHPNLEVYASPINLDPMNAAQPISAPAGFAKAIAERSGRYYTTGIPEDTKSLRGQALNEDEFLEMVHLLDGERTRQYHDALASFDAGFLFFYFGHTDQLQHVFWRDIDPQHPGRDPAQGDRYAHVIEDVYREMDVRVGEALAVLDADDVLIVMSDHGFSSFRRGLNLNTWLRDQGYLVQTPGADRTYLQYVDWSKTRAYAIGINSIYINVLGREPQGIVPPAEQRKLMDEISAKLLTIRDPEFDDTPVIVKMYATKDVYPGADGSVAPDLLVGYAENYRASWATTTGNIREHQYNADGTIRVDRTLEDNKERWSGDHCIADYLVPGVFFSNRRIDLDDPTLSDVAPTILRTFGLAEPKEMHGRPLWK